MRVGNQSIYGTGYVVQLRLNIEASVPPNYAKPMKIPVRYPEEQFPDIIATAYSREEVEIELPGKPALFLAQHPGASTGAAPRRPRAQLLGAWEGKVALPTDEEWDAMDKEIEDEMLNEA